jgi:hypothetical protein
MKRPFMEMDYFHIPLKGLFETTGYQSVRKPLICMTNPGLDLTEKTAMYRGFPSYSTIRDIRILQFS